jgi:hypothetical protein
MTDNDNSSHFPKLNDTNYAEWSVYMEAELIRKSLWGNIEIIIDKTGKDANTVRAEWQLKLNKWNLQKMVEALSEMLL